MLVQRLQNRPDSEHEQALIRIVIVGSLLLYLVIQLNTSVSISPDLEACVKLGTIYVLLSCVYLAMIVINPAPSPARRLSAMVTDFATISSFLHIGGAAAAPFYGIYLWIALGNGFRYGLPYLAASVVTAVCGFFTMMLITPFWQEELGLGLGLLATLVILPAYAATLIRKLTEAKAQAELASQSKSRFLASMSHELRTPLNAIIGTSDLLRETRLDEPQRDMVQTVKTSGAALLSLIDDILDLSRIEANKAAIVVEDVDFYVEIAGLSAMFRAQAMRKGLTFGVHVSPDVPYRVRADVRHIRQILTNLIANALKFTESGFVQLRVAVTDGPMPTACRLTFDVEDSGIGIAPENHAHVFERFTQADDKVNRRFGGTGLGLAISKSLVVLMGGTISLRSALGQGSTFTVDVPVQRPGETGDGGVLPALPRAVLLVSRDARVCADLRAHADTLGLKLIVTADVDEGERVLNPVKVDGAACRTVLIDTRDDGIGNPERLSTAAGAATVTFIRLDEPTPVMASQSMYSSLLTPPINADVLVRALHLAHAIAAGGATDEAGSLESAITHGRRLRILMAEDNPVNQKVTRRILEHARHEVVIVETGEAALDALEQGGFDLMIVDVNMPGISGIDVVKLHRMASLNTERLPILALSADATPETRIECEEAGVDGYLTKPVEARRLLSEIVRVTAEHPVAEPGNVPLVAPGVANIADHPRFRPETVPSVNWSVVDNLSEFGDDDFIIETFKDYVANTELLVGEIKAAVARLDPSAFRDRLHALRGTSGNVGAEAIWRLCKELHGITRDRLRDEGDQITDMLSRELDRFKRELSRYIETRQSMP